MLIGRVAELKELKAVAAALTSCFVAVYGRRRVGKTFLIRQAFKNKFDFHLTGITGASLSQQLTNFHLSWLKTFPGSEERNPPENWLEALERLTAVLEKASPGKKIIFLDELPWLDTPKSGFIHALEHFWNSWASARTDILLIVCGSAATWMIHRLINNRGGLHNRVTHRIRLRPFTLAETEAFFKAKGAAFDRYSLLLLYMVMGGIPFYLEAVRCEESATQNIDRLCFSEDGLLRGEFENLYRSLFLNAEKHIAVIEALAKKGKGMTRSEILLQTKFSDGGGITRMLRELEESHFIRNYPSFGTTGKKSLYQLTDPYSLFYLKWTRGHSTLDTATWINGLDSPAQRSWSGYAFGQVCLSHIDLIKKALGISGVQTQTSAWKTSGPPKGAQIDLLIDRRDHVINLCEMKFSMHPFTIDKAYAETLRNKMEVFKTETGTRKAIYLTLITTFGLAKTPYTSIIQNALTMEALFD
ncbi:MAG: AAA family ATPase [Flavisolibacter sp.]